MNATAPRRCVLVVEDEMQLAMLLEDILKNGGHRVLKAARLPAALALAETEAIDAAILDINLAGKQVFPVADALQRRRIPFLFASGYGEDGLSEDYWGWPMLQKPYGIEDLQQALALLLSGDSASIRPMRSRSS